jgi:glycosyl transferase family 25
MKDIRHIKTYAINLDKNIKKFDELNKRFNKLGIYPERFKAIYAKELDKDYIDKITHPYTQYTIQCGRNIDSDIANEGAIGCYLSHIKLWKKLLDSDQDYFLILEDDACPVYEENIINDINIYLNTVIDADKNWDIIYLGYNKNFINKDIKINGIYSIKSIIFTTHAYIISKKGALKLLKNALPIIHQIDSYMSFMYMNRDVKAYRDIKSYITQKNIESNIQTDNGGLFFDPPTKVMLNRLDNKFLSKLFLLLIFMSFISLYLLRKHKYDKTFYILILSLVALYIYNFIFL